MPGAYLTTLAPGAHKREDPARVAHEVSPMANLAPHSTTSHGATLDHERLHVYQAGRHGPGAFPVGAGAGGSR